MRKKLGSALSTVLVVLYAVGAYYTATHAQQSPWAVALAIGPLTIAGLLFVRKALGLLVFIPALIATPLLLIRVWPYLQHHLGMTYYLQHLGLMLCGALGFGLSLRGPRIPLCTQFAGYVHATVTPQLRDYTRKVTVAWTLFFLVMAVISTLLFFSPLPFAIWSAFDTLLTLPLVGLMFAAEYAVRRHLMPDETGQSITSAYRAYQAHRAAQSGSPRQSHERLAEPFLPFQGGGTEGDGAASCGNQPRWEGLVPHPHPGPPLEGAGEVALSDESKP